MARNAKEEMTWKPRRLRKQDIEARVAHLQKNLPHVVREVFAYWPALIAKSAVTPVVEML